MPVAPRLRSVPAAPTRRGPGRPPRDDDAPTSTERILAAATRLFAERGYDAVGMREIAAAADLTVATVHHHVGSKSDLYAAVFERMFLAEQEALEAAAVRVRAHAPDSPESALTGLHDLLDTYLDLLESEPATTYLWLRRWLTPTTHHDLDDEFAAPLYRLVEAYLTDAHARGLVDEPTPHVAVRSVAWAVHGHVTALAARPEHADEERAAFRAYAHRWLNALYARPTTLPTTTPMTTTTPGAAR